MKICQDLSRYIGICEDLERSDQICWELSKYAIITKYIWWITLTFCVATDAPDRKAMVDGNGDVYQWEGNKKVNEFISAIYKERQVWHLKKICKTFVKDLKYTHLINIWNVMWVGDKYLDLRSTQPWIWHANNCDTLWPTFLILDLFDLWFLSSDTWHTTYNIWHLTFNIQHLTFNSWQVLEVYICHLTSDIWHLTIMWYLNYVVL